MKRTIPFFFLCACALAHSAKEAYLVVSTFCRWRMEHMWVRSLEASTLTERLSALRWHTALRTSSRDRCNVSASRRTQTALFVAGTSRREASTHPLIQVQEGQGPLPLRE